MLIYRHLDEYVEIYGLKTDDSSGDKKNIRDRDSEEIQGEHKNEEDRMEDEGLYGSYPYRCGLCHLLKFFFVVCHMVSGLSLVSAQTRAVRLCIFSCIRCLDCLIKVLFGQPCTG